MSDNDPSQQSYVEQQGQQQQASEQQEEQQRSLQHPHLPSNLVNMSDQTESNPILQVSMDTTSVAPAVDHGQNDQAEAPKQEEQQSLDQQQEGQQHQQPQQEPQAEENVGQEFTTQNDQENQTAANFFDQNYQQYDFPTSSAALSAAAANANVSAFPFHPHPHPQHPHLGVEALGHAAAASQHAGRVPVPDVSAPEGDGGNHHVFGASNGGDHSMDMTMSSSAGDTTTASLEQAAEQARSSGKAPRTSLSVPGSDGSGTKKDTPYSRSPDMRNSHKLAERKRRKEMKDLFDELRDQLPVDRGPKTSKWEILSKAVVHIRNICKERDDMAAELHALRGGEAPVQSMTGVEDGGMEAPAPAPEEGNGSADDYSKYEQQQVASQQQVEAAAAAANQFTTHHGYAQQGHEEHTGQQEGDYKPQEEQTAQDNVHEQATEQDWGAIAAQAAQAQAAQ